MTKSLTRLLAPLLTIVVLVATGWIGEAWIAQLNDKWYGPQDPFLFQLLASVIWLAAAYLAIRFVDVFIWDGIVARTTRSPVPKLLHQISAVVIFILAIAGIVGFVFEQSVTALLTTSGAVGLLIGLAARNVIQDLFTGLSLNMERAFVVGEYISVQARGASNLFGRVEEITWRTTRLMTPEGSVLVIPNSTIGDAVILNVSRPTPISEFELTLILDANVPTERAKRLLLAALQQSVTSDFGPLAKPEPTARVSAMHERGIAYKMKYFLDPRRGGPGKARSLILENVMAHLSAAGIRPALPKFEPHPIEPDQYPILVADAPEPAKLSTHASIAALDASTRDALLQRAKVRSAAAGESVTHLHPGLYYLIEGFLTVNTAMSPGTESVAIGQISPGQIVLHVPGTTDGFSVRAQVPSTLVALDGEPLDTFLRDYPEANAMFNELSGRQAALREDQLAAYREKSSRDANLTNRKKRISELAGRVRNFFSNSALGALAQGWFGRRQRERLLEGTMAACALIATADGTVDPAERDHALSALQELGLFRHFNAQRAVELFDADVSALAADPQGASAILLSTVGKLSGSRNTAELILSICRALGAADGVADESESRRLGQIAVALGVPEANTGHFDESL